LDLSPDIRIYFLDCINLLLLAQIRIVGDLADGILDRNLGGPQPPGFAGIASLWLAAKSGSVSGDSDACAVDPVMLEISF
jgi:hypothetical protein